MRIVWRVLRGGLALVGLLAVLVLGGAGVAAWRLLDGAGGRDLPDRFVLKLDLRQKLAEAPGAGDLLNLQASLNPDPTVSELVLTLDEASRDRRVVGLLALVDETEQGWAVTQELRDAVTRLRAGGKWAVAWADSFGELGPATQGYYLATAFETIDLQPAGTLGLTGLGIEQPYLGAALAKVGVSLDVLRRSEYKSALENFAAETMSAPTREMLTALLDDLTAQAVAGVAEGRRLAPERVRQLMAEGPYAADRAKELGLVDGLSHLPEVMARVSARAGDAATVDVADYPPERDAGRGATRVAVVAAEGAIMRGDGRTGIAAERLAAQLTDAAEDDDVDAVILRLSSPGGSPAGSERVADVIRRMIAAGKPVIVSMGDVAASGGYWLAMGATKIVAQPGTLTGSIGVIAGKPVLQGLWDRLDVRWVTLGEPGAATGLAGQPYDPAVRARLDALVGDLYDDFKAGVGAGRKLSAERVEAVARGRVWSGAAALQQGLVDRQGGLLEALAAAREALGLPAEAALDVRLLPRRRQGLERLLDLAEANASMAGTLAAVRAQFDGPGQLEWSPPTVR